ncbi:MAG: cobalamin-independent methionine synthase II family protein [Chloroflexi bacterium]|nr:cobalamin-independent methionine synthase II family protein [Chloroflexota bacterium]
MKRSSDRILTTHTGSLPRPPDLLAMIQAKDAGQAYDENVLAEKVRSSVAQVVKLQAEAGIDVICDGEFGKPNFASYVKDRLGGFGGQNPDMRVFSDRAEFPEWNARVAPSGGLMVARPMCVGPLSVNDGTAVQTDIDNLRAATADVSHVEAFIPSASLGIISEIMVNGHYPSEEAYLYALADVMKEEYQAIANAGFLLQIDAPDAAMGRHAQFHDRSLKEFRTALALRVEAQNHALAGIPEEQIRFHICWGNYEGPHNHDVALSDIVDLVLKIKAGAYSIEASNPRHEHEWLVWENVKLPDGKILIPGVIDSTTHFIEHPELVAQRIVRFANLVGRENVIAGADCGFGTTAGVPRIDPAIMWAKFGALAQGAQMASEQLWR